MIIAKAPLSLLIAFSALFGFQYGSEGYRVTSIVVFAAVFFLSCGAASLNSYQERENDGRMQRTRHRPLVVGLVSSRSALLQAATLIASGLLLLISIDKGAFFAGVAGVGLYNFVYTRLKPISFAAIIPGAICGALPPYIGWLAAGGKLISFHGVLPFMLFILWQIPHFFLVLLNHKDDYIKSVSPNILKVLSEKSLQRIFLPWITALAVAMLGFTVLPPFGMSRSARLMIILNAVILVGVFFYHILLRKAPGYRDLFRHLTLSIFIFMLLVCIKS